MASPRQPSPQPGLMGLLLVLLVMCPTLGWAQSADEPEDQGVGLLVGVRGVGEIWQEPLLIRELGRSSRFGGSGFLSYRAWRFLSADLEVGYHRLTGTEHGTSSGNLGTESTTFELVPLSLSVSAAHRIGSVEVFAAVGAAFTVFTHSARALTVSGTKVGPTFQLGARWDTGLVQPSIRRDARNPLKSADVELVLGRRQHQPFGIGEGLDLSAWRVGVGLLARM